MRRVTSRLALLAGTLGVCAFVAAAALLPAAQAAKKKGRADSGASYAADDGTCGPHNSDLCVSGYTLDKLFGDIAITYVIAINNNAGNFHVVASPVVMYTKTGALTGTGTATLATTPYGAVTITGGKLDLTKGSGGQKGHKFIGTFTGRGNGVTGYYQFFYKGTYF
jgi:hypothetical protein